MIPAQLQAGMAKNMGAKVVNVDSSHVAMLSQPQKVAAAIIAAAEQAK